jgi:hypothetical protein
VGRLDDFTRGESDCGFLHLQSFRDLLLRQLNGHFFAPHSVINFGAYHVSQEA